MSSGKREPQRERSQGHSKVLCGSTKVFVCMQPLAAELVRPLKGAPGGWATDPWGFVHHRWLILTFPPCLSRIRSHPLGSSAAARCAVGLSCWRLHLSTWRLPVRTTGYCRPSTSLSKLTPCERPRNLSQLELAADSMLWVGWCTPPSRRGSQVEGHSPWPASHLYSPTADTSPSQSYTTPPGHLATCTV